MNVSDGIFVGWVLGMLFGVGITLRLTKDLQNRAESRGFEKGLNVMRRLTIGPRPSEVTGPTGQEAWVIRAR